jgi:hypothetical protein
MNAEFDRNGPPMFQRPVLRRTCNNWPKTGRERAGNVQLNPPKKRAKAAILSAFIDCLKIRFPHGSVGSSPTGGTIALVQPGQRFIAIYICPMQEQNEQTFDSARSTLRMRSTLGPRSRRPALVESKIITRSRAGYLPLRVSFSARLNSASVRGLSPSPVCIFQRQGFSPRGRDT